MRNAGTSTTCAGRSLSYAHGSVDVPIANGPPSTSTSSGRSRRVRARRARSVARVRMREVVHELDGREHRLVVLVLVVDDQPVDEPVGEQRVVARRASLPASTSSTRLRTSAMKSRASDGPRMSSVGRSDRG